MGRKNDALNLFPPNCPHCALEQGIVNIEGDFIRALNYYYNNSGNSALRPQKLLLSVTAPPPLFQQSYPRNPLRPVLITILYWYSCHLPSNYVLASSYTSETQLFTP